MNIFLALKSSKRESHFVNKMILSNMINVLIIAVICIVFYIGAVQSINRESEKYTSQIIFQISVSLDSVVDNLQEMAWRILSNEDVIQNLQDNVIDGENQMDTVVKNEKMTRAIYNAAGYSNNIEAFTLFSLNGRTYDAGNKSTKYGYSYKSEPWYSEMKDENTNTLILNTHLQTHVVEGTEAQVISLIKKINDPKTKELLGYVLIDLNANIYNQIFNKNNMISNSSIIVEDKRGNEVYTSLYARLKDNEVKDILSHIGKGISGNYEGKYSNTNMEITYYTSAKTGWKIIYVYPISEINKTLVYMKSLTIVITVASMILAILLSVMLSKMVTRPLIRLSKGIKQLEKGNLNVAVNINSNDEIGALGKSFNKMVEELKNLIEKVYKSEIAKKEANIQALQAQINPHFLYNTLAVIDGIASVNGQSEIKSIVQALGKIFRYSISGSEVTTLEEEMDYVRMYIDIQKVRLYNMLEAHVIYDEMLNHCTIPKLVIQPLLENAFVHGFTDVKGNALITISAVRDGNDVVITVEDNGTGISEEKLTDIKREIEIQTQEKSEFKSIGLRNVNQRLKSFYGEDYGLFIKNNDIGTTSGIRIPYSLSEVENDS